MKDSAKTPRDLYSRRLREVRQMRRMTQQDLAAAMDEVGLPMNRITISKVERSERPIEVGELLALTAVLAVWPLALVFEADDPRLRGDLPLTEKKKVPLQQALAWALAEEPLEEGEDESGVDYREIPGLGLVQIRPGGGRIAA